jgi:hypothetical protein
VIGALTAPLLLAGVVVLGEGRDGCPSARAVSTRVQALLGDEDGGLPDALIFDGEAGALRVRLISAEGAVREEKSLDLRGSCADLADAVATLGVTWRSRLQSDEVPPPVLPPPPEPAPVEQVHEAPPEPAPRRHDFEVSVGVETQSGLKRWAPAVMLGAQLPVSPNYSVGLTLDVSAPRTDVDLIAQRWTWMQVNLVAAAARRFVTESLYLDGQLGLGVGINANLTENTVQSRRYQTVPPSLVAGFRWTYRRAQGMPWFGITWSLSLDPKLDSPVQNTDVAPERWVLGLSLGGTVGFDGGR